VSIKYQPKKILKKMAPDELIERLVTQKLTLNRTVLNQLERAGILPKKQLERVAMKVIRDYKRSFKEEKKTGASNRAAYEDAVNEKRLMIQRVKDATISEITRIVKVSYRGERYRWLPSTAESPDPKHMKKYGKVYKLGKGEAPGDRYGCKCGMEILVNETKLDLSED
jgi:hypothetical protein